jgi:hypothetical protein
MDFNENKSRLTRKDCSDHFDIFEIKFLHGRTNEEYWPPRFTKYAVRSLTVYAYSYKHLIHLHLTLRLGICGAIILLP